MVVNLEAVLANPENKADLGADHGSRFGGGGRDDGRDEGIAMPDELARQLEDELVPAQVFEHELAHLALSRVSRESTTGWVLEGGAMLLADERRIGSWRLGQLFGIYDRVSFADLSEMGKLNGAISYAYANAAVSYLVETFGEKKF